jgi:FkbM family methyltransferase
VSLPSFLIRSLHLGSWPPAVRKPLVLGLIRRKSLTSLPFTTRYHGMVFEGDAANLIDYHVLSRGAFEPGLSALLGDWGKRHAAGVFLDVGANVGIHTLANAANFAKIIAVEPFPPVANRLRRALEINRVSNVTLCEAALADAEGKTVFRIPIASNLGTGRIVSEGETASSTDCVEVPLRTGDGLLAGEKLPLSALKIDTEGAEARVLAGLGDRLRRDRPLVVFELLDPGEAAARKLTGLLPEDYRFFLLEGIKRRRATLRSWTGGHGDIVAVPAEKTSLIGSWTVA